MKTTFLHRRSSGVLAHLTSLPSPFGIGDLGPATYKFLDFLQQAEQSVWQILPTGPTDAVFSHSPYMSVSAFAGNPLLISPDVLYRHGLLQKSDLEDAPPFSPYQVDFNGVLSLKGHLLKKAYLSFNKNKSSGYEEFIQKTKWLEDYCLFMTIKDLFPQQPWYKWSDDIIQRRQKTMETIREEHFQSYEYYLFEQYIFNKQWHNLHDYAESKGIQIFGDIPIYISLDSADVWANQEIFQLSTVSKQPTLVAGVPPDYFSETGQKWGNPLYDWDCADKSVQEKLLLWWASRLSTIFSTVDIARIDHFRGFESYFAIPAEDENAVNGIWKSGPGVDFFHSIFKLLGKLNIVAEDLGEITDAVTQLRDELSFPGMKVLQFAFDGNKKNSFLPYNYDTSNCIVYTGTHDNDTSVGWFLSNRHDDAQRSKIRAMANRALHDSGNIHEDLIYLAMSSIAALSIFPLQDILGFGSDCRMNTPGTATGNWVWRCSQEFLTEEKAQWLGNTTKAFGRERIEKVASQETLHNQSTIS